MPSLLDFYPWIYLYSQLNPRAPTLGVSNCHWNRNKLYRLVTNNWATRATKPTPIQNNSKSRIHSFGSTTKTGAKIKVEAVTHKPAIPRPKPIARNKDPGKDRDSYSAARASTDSPVSAALASMASVAVRLPNTSWSTSPG